MVDMLTCHSRLKTKSKTGCRFLIGRENKTLAPKLSGVYTNFDSFLPYTYKFGTVYTLACRCLRICLSWTKLHNEFVCLTEIFLKNGYPEDFLNKCFKRFMDNIHVVKESTLTVGKKPLVLVLPYFNSISLQTRTKLNNSLKSVLNCCKVQIVNKIRFLNNFHFKNQIPKHLVRILFALIVAPLFLFNGLFYYYFVICKCMTTTVPANGTVQFTFFFVIRFCITVATSCDSFILILVT